MAYFRFFLLIVLVLGFVTSINAKEDLYIPEILKPWVDWVLYDNEDRNCPHAYHDGDKRFCSWASRIDFELEDTQGRFTQQWQVHSESWVPLPGDEKHWPQQVQVNGVESVVIKGKSGPGIKLQPGAYTVTGQFRWHSLPELITIPADTALINIRLNGKDLLFPKINWNGNAQIWLDKSPQIESDENTEDIQVFRKVYDGHPLELHTKIVFNISGNPRDILFPKILPEGFTPIELTSPLPARISQQSDLQVQVRPGKWTLDLISYRSKDLSSLAKPKVDHPSWPDQEIWVYEANPGIRMADITNVPTVDARQTPLPEAWHKYPAYYLEKDAVLKLTTTQRGSAEPEPNRLTLNRKMWLDFNGEGYTIKDQINGNMNRGQRISALGELELGRVRIFDEPQLITRLDKDQSQGVEIRRDYIELSADSRYQQDITQIPVNGWQESFQGVATNLYLPPGWAIFSAHGSDNVPDTWLQRWTLLDIFMVLIISISFTKLWSWRWGVVALVGMIIIWYSQTVHQGTGWFISYGAPRFIWINLLIAIALLRLLPKGIIRTIVYWYRNLSLFILFLIVFPYAIGEIRHGIYPQLGFYPDYDKYAYSDVKHKSGISPPKFQLELDQSMKEPWQSISGGQNIPMGQLKKGFGKRVIDQVDPSANIQTGPGLPTWEYQPVVFEWHSPVNPDQRLKLRFITPAMNLILSLLSVAFMLALIYRLLMPSDNPTDSSSSSKKWSFPWSKATASALIPFTLLAGLASDIKAGESDISIQIEPNQQISLHEPISPVLHPQESLLKELENRLLEADDCLPDCAFIETMQLELMPDSLNIHLLVHAANNTVVPLPANYSNQFHVEHVVLDFETTEYLSRRDGSAFVWINVPKGTHRIIVQGRLSGHPQIPISLPLQTQYASWKGDGWTVEGIDKNNKPAEELLLIRNQDAPVATKLTEDTTLHPLLLVERTLHLGMDWTVETIVKRLSPVGSPISMHIPLLANEQVLADAARVKDNTIAINLDAQQVSTRWQSRLPVSDALALAATDVEGLVESWRLDISPIWHVNISGIPAIHNLTDSEQWLPEWRPWPGEEIKLEISRPKGISGRTLTIERSQYSSVIGKRSRDNKLLLDLRSSRGGQHDINLPEGSELLAVRINGQPHPIRQKDQKVSIPIIPGSQSIFIGWRDTKEISHYLKLPALDLGLDSVNTNIEIELSEDRWILFVGGPQMGPAVVVWGSIIVVLLGAIILGRLKGYPLKTWQWFLFGVGLILVTPFQLMVVLLWFFVLRYRPLLDDLKDGTLYNFAQIGIVLLTLVTFGVLFYALQQGFLGYPDMQIAGNGSSAWNLRWYQDRSDAQLAQPWVISIPLIVYRLLMLGWALWLAFSLIRWLKWGWGHFSKGGIWRKF